MILMQKDFLKNGKNLFQKSEKYGKTGLRIFVETDTILIERFENALIRFGEILADYLSFLITCIYAYKREEIGRMSQQN